jgi:hypothetical protein
VGVVINKTSVMMAKKPPSSFHATGIVTVAMTVGWASC